MRWGVRLGKRLQEELKKEEKFPQGMRDASMPAKSPQPPVKLELNPFPAPRWEELGGYTLWPGAGEYLGSFSTAHRTRYLVRGLR